MITIVYDDLDGEQVTFTGANLAECHERMLEYLAIRWKEEK